MIGWTRKDKFDIERSCGRNQWFLDYPHLFPLRDDAPCYESEGFQPQPLSGKYKAKLEELCPKFAAKNNEYCCNGILVQNLGRHLNFSNFRFTESVKQILGDTM